MLKKREKRCFWDAPKRRKDRDKGGGKAGQYYLRQKHLD